MCAFGAVGAAWQTDDVFLSADALLTILVVGAVSLALTAALVLVLVSLRRPLPVPLAVASGLVVVALIAVAVLPHDVPVLLGVLLALVGTALAAIGGDPFARWILSVADGGRTAEGPRGGILVELMAVDAPAREEEILRGGATIGYLERVSVALGIVVGFPAVLAVVVALKGVGRFSELATPAARERFIVGTFASLLWASAVAGVVRLAIG